MFRLRSIPLPRLAAGAALFFLSAQAFAFDGLLRTAEGKVAAGYQLSVVGTTVTVTTNAQGRFRIVPSPAVPFVLIATGPGGAVSAPIEVNELPGSGEVEVFIPEVFKDAITVVAGVAPSIETPPAAATVVLAQESLEQQRPNRLTDALEGVAGVSRTDQTTTAVPVIRGLGRGRTLVLLDGARVTTERRAGASASFLDPFTLAAIEVARGAGSVTYGSDAMGGVIHAQPRYPEPGSPGLHLMVNQAFGAEDETSAGAEISRDALGGALLAQVTYREADDQEAGGGESIADSAYGDHSAALRYTKFLGTGRLRVGLFAAQAEDVGKPASDSNTTHTLYPKESAERLNVAYEGGPVGSWETLEGSIFFGRYRLITDRDRVATATALRLLERSDVDADDASLRGVASRALWGGRLRVGSEVVARFNLEAIASRRTFDAAGNVVAAGSTPAIEDASQTDAAVFASFDRALSGHTSLSLGLRGDRVDTENKGGFFGDRSTSHSALSGHAAVTVGPFSNVTTTFQVARGFRDPFLSDRYFRGPSGRGFITGNPDLEPERSLQFDASARWTSGGRSVALYAYRYRIDNLVERFRPANDFFFRNRGEATVEGIELEAQTPLGHGLSFELAAAVARGEAEDGAPVDDIAAPNATSTLRWAGERGFAFLRNLAVLEDDRPGPIEVERPGYTVFDLGGGYRVNPKLEVRILGRNLTDRRYRDSADEVASLARGRSFSLGLVGRY